MIDEKYKRLINKAIDSELSVDDERKLKIFLEHNPEARYLFEDLRHTSELLNKVSEIDPPSDLKQRILNAIDFSCYAKQMNMLRIRSLFPGWLFAPRAKLAYAFVLGIFFSTIVVGPYLRTLLHKQEMDSSYLSGTIKKSENLNYNVIHSIPIDRSGINGIINIKKLKSSVILEFNLDAKAEIEIEIEYDSTQIQFENFKPIGYSKYAFDYERDHLNLILIGSLRSFIYFTQSNPSTQIMLHLSYAGNPVLSQSIILK